MKKPAVDESDTTDPVMPASEQQQSAETANQESKAPGVGGFPGQQGSEMFKNLPSQLESRRSEASKRFSKAMDDLQTAMFTAGQKLNQMTGYSDIERLKESIEQQGG